MKKFDNGFGLCDDLAPGFGNFLEFPLWTVLPKLGLKKSTRFEQDPTQRSHQQHDFLIVKKSLACMPVNWQLSPQYDACLSMLVVTGKK